MASADYWGRTALYRLFSEGGLLLYIGVSSGVDRRWGQHEKSKDWWPDVASSAVEWHDGRVSALAAEKSAIKTEYPAHNKTHSVVRSSGIAHGTSPRGCVRRARGLRLSVERFSAATARENFPWIVKSARYARSELGELPITYITDRGVPTMAVIPAWAAEWIDEHLGQVLASIESGDAPKAT